MDEEVDGPISIRTKLYPVIRRVNARDAVQEKFQVALIN